MRLSEGSQRSKYSLWGLTNVFWASITSSFSPNCFTWNRNHFPIFPLPYYIKISIIQPLKSFVWMLIKLSEQSQRSKYSLWGLTNMFPAIIISSFSPNCLICNRTGFPLFLLSYHIKISIIPLLMSFSMRAHKHVLSNLNMFIFSQLFDMQ